MTKSWAETSNTERPDPKQYLHKREGSPGGLKPAPKPHSPACGSPTAAKPRSPGADACTAPAPTHFRRMYDRGDLPIKVDQSRPGHNTIKWTTDLSTIDLHYYLPVFADGLAEVQEPYRMLARRGFEELVTSATTGGTRVLPVFPQLIMPLRGALRSSSADVIQAGLHAIELLIGCCPKGGASLLPYCRQLLPALSRHVGENLNIGDHIDYGQRLNKGSLGDLVGATLRLLERAGGPDAFAHIKYHVPTYESCLRPSRIARKA